MKIYRFLWLLLLAVSSFAQTHTEMTLEDIQTATAAKTFPQINKTIYVDQLAGATLDVKLAACVTALPLGGICDATGFAPGSSQTIAASSTLGDGIHHYVFKFDKATKIIPGSDIDMFTIPPNTEVFGPFVDVTGVAGYSHSVWTFDGTRFDYPTPNGWAYTTGGTVTPSPFQTSLRDFICFGNGNVLGSCAYYHAVNSSNGDITWVLAENGFIWGFQYGIHMKSESASWINGNWFDRIVASHSVYGLYEECQGGDIASNRFNDYEFEPGSATLRAIRIIKTTGACNSQDFRGVRIWDFAANAISVQTDDLAQSMTFSGGYIAGLIQTAAGIATVPFTPNSINLSQQTLSLKYGGVFFPASTITPQLMVLGTPGMGYVQEQTGDASDTGYYSWWMPIASPTAPTLSQTAGGAIGATTYFAKVTYCDSTNGETTVSGETNFAVSANNLLKITSPVASAGATGYSGYVSTTTGTETQQFACRALASDWTEPTSGLVAGTTSPPNNTASKRIGFFGFSPTDLTLTMENNSKFIISGGTTQFASTISSYNGVATVANGIDPLVAKIDLTGQTASLGATTAYSVPASGAGMYRVSCYAVVTTVGTTSTLPACQIGWTDNDSNSAAAANISSTNAGNTLGTNGTTGSGYGLATVNAKASTTITYATAGYASTGTAMQYALHVKVQYLGN